MQIFPRAAGFSRQTSRVMLLQIRRATVDDLPALKSLWTAAALPATELEARLTEFQVVEASGEFAGALGLQIIRQHARLHSEDYADFAVADGAREMFWERIQTLAANHGVFRVWTQETSPFWKRWGFQPADSEILERLPDEWKNLPGHWLTLELKNEDAIQAALQHHIPEFIAAGKKHTAAVEKRAGQIRKFFTALFFAVAAVCFAVVIYLLLRHPLATR